MATKDKVQRQNIATTLQQLQSGTLLNGIEVMQTVTESNLAKEEQELLLTQLGLNKATAENTVVNTANLISLIEQLALKGKIGQKNSEELLGILANITATKQQTNANYGLSASMKALQASMGWVGWLSIAASFLIPVIIELVGNVKSAKEQFKEISDTISQNNTEIDSLNDEFKTTQERIAELESMGKLSFTDEAELKRLKSENAELERKIRLLAKENEEKSKKAVKTFKKTYNGFDTEWNWSRTTTDVDNNGNLTAGYITEADYIRETIGLYYELIELEKDVNYKGYTTANGRANGIEENITSEELKKELDGYLKLATEYHDAIDKLYESGYVYGSDAEVDKTIDSMYEIIDLYEASQGETTGLFDSVINRDKYSEAHTEIEKLAEAGNLTAESLQSLYNQDDNVKQFYDYISKVFGHDTSNIDKQTAAIKEQADAYNALVNGNVDYNKRPIVSAEKMREKYPEYPDNKSATTYSQTVTIGEGEALYTINVTPILENGDVYDQEHLDAYIDSLITDNGVEGLLASDEKKLIINVQPGDYDEQYWTEYEEKTQGIKDAHLEATEQLNDNSGFDNFANELNKVEDAAEGAETSFKSIAKTLSDDLDKLSNKKDILSEVKEELDSFGAISADNISKILEQFSDNDDVQKAVAYYLSGIGTAQQLYDAMAKGYKNDLKLQAQNLATKMQNDEKYYESIGATNSSFVNWMKTNCYGVDLSNATSLADAKLKIENQLIGTLKTNWQKYYNAQGASLEELVARARALMLNTSHGRETYADEHAEATKKYNEIKQLYDRYKKASDALDDLTLKGFSSTGFNTTLSTDFDKDSGKTEAERYFAQLKYNLETNKITEEQYLKSLDAAYKKYYGNKSKYLEEFEQYSQEVYDGFKDMYKEDLEAQKEAWEEKKDAVSEYYDNLREQIENAHDEEDYEKEQSEKRKEIFDLDMQIAELMREGSEKAKARIAELEEERLKAEEELLDFETDKAREDELSRLEKEQESEEAKIQKQIDGIQGQLDKLDEDTISVRNAIIAYAKQKGVTLNFAYASGTRSSVGGFGRINEKGIEMISAPDGNGNYIPMLPSSYVFSAKATEFLWKLATEHSLPQAMYNSIAKSIKAQSSTPSVNIAQPISITMGDVIIKGNADKQTVADIKRQQENTVRMVLQKIKELQK